MTAGGIVLSTGALLAMHAVVHQGIAALLGHCEALGEAEFDRELAGFGYPSVRLQLHHALGAERYWLGVLAGRVDADDDAHRYPTASALAGWRRDVAENTVGVIGQLSDAELAEPRTVTTWRGTPLTVLPVHVVLRVLLHHRHHQGQVTAMCRLLGKPCARELDFPLV